MLRRGIDATANFFGVRRERSTYLFREIGVPLDEARCPSLGEAEEVVVHEHLAIAFGPAPIPIVGTVSDSVMRAATGTGTASSTIAKQPAASSASASARSCCAFAAVRPCVLNPPRIVSDCGVRPTCPITPMPAETIALTRESEGPAPSSLTTSAPASLTNLIALRDGVFVGHVVAPERHVADDERPLALRPTRRA